MSKDKSGYVDTLVDGIERLRPFFGRDVYVGISLDKRAIFLKTPSFGSAWIEPVIEGSPPMGVFAKCKVTYNGIEVCPDDFIMLVKLLNIRRKFEVLAEAWHIRLQEDLLNASETLMQSRLLVAKTQRKIQLLESSVEPYFRGNSRRDYITGLSQWILEEAEAFEQWGTAKRALAEWPARLEKWKRLFGIVEGGA